MIKNPSPVVGITIPPISRVFYEHVAATFRPRPALDNDTLIAIGRNAGRQEVIEFMKRFVAGSTIIGDPEAIEPPVTLSETQAMMRGKDKS